VKPDEFPAAFTYGWALPRPDAFLDYFLPVIAPDAMFVQPGFPNAHGHSQIARMFRRLFTLFPDLTATPECSAVAGDTVFIASTCATTIGRRVVQFDVCDRFLIRDGKIVQRRSYSDPTPTMLQLARNPTTWARVVKSRMLSG
jgi:limonene-1,2-epoxide hydrolase